MLVDYGRINVARVAGPNQKRSRSVTLMKLSSACPTIPTSFPAARSSRTVGAEWFQ
ncbi:hypothetical protein AHiyo8_29370 [Arthrobacter sp. Hiyo8]|nr:hypothetical protein AHiyo8_29370 [Arthrobacter sp. Hiyo8]